MCGEKTEGRQGLFLSRSQQPVAGTGKGSWLSGLSCRLAQRGAPWPLQQWVGRGAHHPSGDTNMEMAFTHKQILMESGPVLWLPVNQCIFTDTSGPPCLPPPGSVGGGWDTGIEGWTRLRVGSWCYALGEVALPHQLDDKTLLMAPIKKCECNFLLPVISPVFGILFNRSTGPSWSLLKPSLSFFVLEDSENAG